MRTQRIILVIIISFPFIITNSNAQTNYGPGVTAIGFVPQVRRLIDTIFEKQPFQTPEIGTAWQKSFFLEIGLLHATDDNGDVGGTDFTMFGYKLAYAWTPFIKNKIQAPEASAELNLFFITLRTSMIYYLGGINNITHTDLRFVPEVGFTLFGITTICYGWNIPLIKDRVDGVAPHRWSINFNFVQWDF